MTAKQKYYAEKERVRQEAIEWQNGFESHDYSWFEIAEWEDYFYKLGERYGLLREFHENGIC